MDNSRTQVFDGIFFTISLPKSILILYENVSNLFDGSLVFSKMVLS